MSIQPSAGPVSRFWSEVYNGKNLGLIEEIFEEGYTLHDLANRKRLDLEEVRQLVSALHTAVPNSRVEVVEQLRSEDGSMVTRFVVHMAGVEHGEALNGMSIDRFSEEGRLEESWLLWESLLAERVCQPEIRSWGWRWPPWR